MPSQRAVTRKEQIDYLVLRRFPLARLINNPPSINSSSGSNFDIRQLRADVHAYRAELVALAAEALNERYDEEQRKQVEATKAAAEAEERSRFFNQPSANADYAHWSRTAHWTLDEAIALSFGKAPERVAWDKVTPFLQVSPFAREYARRRDLATRALSWQQLFDPVLPGIFLAWANRTEIPVPAQLIAAVEARGIQVADWKSLYEKSEASAKKLQNQWLELNERKDSLIASLTARLDALQAAAEAVERERATYRAQLERATAVQESDRAEWLAASNRHDELVRELRAQLAEAQQPPAPSEKPPGTKERESLLKLVIGMAVKGYVYDPRAERGKTPTEIASDLASIGLAMDPDTVRKYLREAAQVLPREKSGGH